MAAPERFSDEIADQVEKFMRIEVEEADHGSRLDRWFHRHHPEFPFRQVQEAIRERDVRLNDERASPDQRLVRGDVLVIFKKWFERMQERPASGPLFGGVNRDEADTFFKENVIYQDDAIVVINKPAGLATQGGTGQRRSVDRLLNVALGALESGDLEAYLVHRLDRETSGVLIVARKAELAAHFGAALQGGEVDKVYLGVALGTTPEEGRIEDPITIRKPSGEVVEKEAETNYKVLSYRNEGEALSFLEITPATGRKHQIRRHFASIEAPLYGDERYGGGRDGVVLHLHALRLTCEHPVSGERVTFEAPMPATMAATLSEGTWTATVHAKKNDSVPA